MCTVSNIGDGWKEQFPIRYPNIDPFKFTPDQISRSEFEALKREVEGLRELLKAAKKFDQESGQPNCSMEEKVELIKQVAKVVGVDLHEVFGDL